MMNEVKQLKNLVAFTLLVSISWVISLGLSHLNLVSTCLLCDLQRWIFCLITISSITICIRKKINFSNWLWILIWLLLVWALAVHQVNLNLHPQLSEQCLPNWQVLVDMQAWPMLWHLFKHGDGGCHLNIQFLGIMLPIWVLAIDTIFVFWWCQIGYMLKSSR